MQNPNSQLLSQLNFSSPSSYPISAYSPKLKISITFPSDEDRTKQSFKGEADINNIMARYQKTGVIDFAREHEGQYGDVIGADYQAAMQLVAQANSMFADLPSSVRARFEQSAAKFLDFIQDERNRDEAREMGLLKPEAQPTGASSTPP